MRSSAVSSDTLRGHVRRIGSPRPQPMRPRQPVPSALLRTMAAALFVAASMTACAAQPVFKPSNPAPAVIGASSGPPELGIDWARAKPVERPADFNFATAPPPFNGGAGHPLHNPGQAMMADVVEVPDRGFVSVGYAYPGWRPVAWTSPDGIEWAVHPMGTTDFTFPVSLVTLADGTLVAVGRSGPRPVAWTSPDGLTWAEHPVSILGDGTVAERMTSVMSIDNGLLAGGSVGPELGERHARFWRSTDGVTWVPSPDDADAFAEAEVRALTRLGDGFVAIGLIGSAQETVGSVAWLSRDGETWERVDDAALATGKTLALSTAPWGGVVAVGSEFDRREAAVWSSSDGRRWTKAPSEASRRGGNGYAWMTDIVPIGDLLIAIGDYQDLQRPTALSWVSRDGKAWTEARAAPVQQGAEFYAVVGGGPGLIAVGSYGSPDDYIPTVWLSPGRE